MERDEKIQLILDMQEHPEQFSEQALQAMLDDPEVCQLMEATTQLKQAMKTEDGKTVSLTFKTCATDEGAGRQLLPGYLVILTN